MTPRAEASWQKSYRDPLGNRSLLQRRNISGRRCDVSLTFGLARWAALTMTVQRRRRPNLLPTAPSERLLPPITSQTLDRMLGSATTYSGRQYATWSAGNLKSPCDRCSHRRLRSTVTYDQAQI